MQFEKKPFMNANIPTLYPTHKSIINCNASAKQKAQKGEEEKQLK